MDEIDLAQQINEQLQQDAFDNHRRRMTSGASRTHCIECDDPIPEARRRAMPGCERCIVCQTILEIHVHGRG